MSSQIILDLGDYGSIIVESAKDEMVTISTDADPGPVQAGLGDMTREVSQKIVVKAQKTLQMSLTGLANTLAASLPQAEVAEHYLLDTFTVEFQMGIGIETGAEAVAVAKITPNGNFKCTYTWKRKPEKSELLLGK